MSERGVWGCLGLGNTRERTRSFCLVFGRRGLGRGFIVSGSTDLTLWKVKKAQGLVSTADSKRRSHQRVDTDSVVGPRGCACGAAAPGAPGG